MSERNDAVAIVLAARGSQDLKGEVCLPTSTTCIHTRSGRCSSRGAAGPTRRPPTRSARRWPSGTSTTTRSSPGARPTSCSTVSSRSSSRSGGARMRRAAVRSRSSPTRGRRPGTSFVTSSHGTACLTPSIRATRTRVRSSCAGAVRRDRRCRSYSCRTGTRSSIRDRRTSRSTGRGCERSSTILGRSTS